MRPCTLRSILALALLACAIPPGVANAREFLPVGKAFQVEVTSATAEHIILGWTIAPGYYLYRDRISVSAGADHSPALGDPALPSPDEVIHDPYFGTMAIYRHDFSVRVPIQAAGARPSRLDIQVRYQGCAEDGICYAPVTETLRIIPAALTGGTTGGGAVAGGDPGAPAMGPSEQDRLAALLADGALAWTVLAFFGAGLLLAFSPCMLPMLPILSSVIVGAEGGKTRYRGLILSLAYVLPMALAYAALGTVAGLVGGHLQAYLQSPWVLVPFAGLFVLLALVLFGFFELRLPASLQNRLAAASSRQRGGQLAGVATMGLLSALIVAPCMTAPLAGALLYIGHTGNAGLGGLALFVLGLGMGTPLIAMGTVGGRVLPRAGAWMRRVEVVFGFVLLAVAIWMLDRVLPAPAILALWGFLLAGVAVALGALDSVPAGAGPSRRLGRVVGVAAGLWSVALVVGAAAGATHPLRPLAFLTETEAPSAAAESSGYIPVDGGWSELQARLAAAEAAGKPVVVDFYADWCVSCQVIEREVFGDPTVRRAMADVVRLRPDLTAYDERDRALLERLDVLGPPTLLFFGADGVERQGLRIVGKIGPQAFLHHLRRAFGGDRTW